jgi:hypothetical protein
MCCNQLAGKIYDKLFDDWFNCDFFVLLDDQARLSFIKSIEKILNKMSNEKIVDELYGEGCNQYDKEYYVKIEHIPKNKIIIL